MRRILFKNYKPRISITSQKVGGWPINFSERLVGAGVFFFSPKVIRARLCWQWAIIIQINPAFVEHKNTSNPENRGNAKSNQWQGPFCWERTRNKLAAFNEVRNTASNKGAQTNAK